VSVRRQASRISKPGGAIGAIGAAFELRLPGDGGRYPIGPHRRELANCVVVIRYIIGGRLVDISEVALLRFHEGKVDILRSLVCR
jgi:hypothetical protein